MSNSEENEQIVPPDFAPGSTVFGLFEIISSIGCGGMGTVYKVRHKLLNTKMALKVLHNGTGSDKHLMRFQREAKTLSKLSQENIARIYDFGLEGTTPYLSMAFIDGLTLEEILARRGKLSLPEFEEMFGQVARGLAHAHSNNVIHRDLKPGNIMVSDFESGSMSVVIVDFGVAKFQEDFLAGSLTQSGGFIGSPFYCSPEQSSDGIVTAASDLYSLGCVMFHALVGKPPFRGDSLIETLSMHAECEPPLEEFDNDLPDEIVELIGSLLKKDPADRSWTASRIADYLKNTMPQSLNEKRVEQTDDENVTTESLPEVANALSSPVVNKRPTLIVLSVLVFLMIVSIYFFEEQLGIAALIKSNAPWSTSKNVSTHPSDNQISITQALGYSTKEKLSDEISDAVDLFDNKQYEAADKAFTNCILVTSKKGRSVAVADPKLLLRALTCALIVKNEEKYKRYFSDFFNVSEGLPERITDMQKFCTDTFGKINRLDLSERVASDLRNFAHKSGDVDSEVRSINVLANVRLRQKRISESLGLIDTGLELLRTPGHTNRLLYFKTLSTRVQINVRAERYSQAQKDINVIEKMLKDDPRLEENKYQRYVCKFAQAQIETYSTRDYSKAKTLALEALRLAKVQEKPGTTSEITYRVMKLIKVIDGKPNSQKMFSRIAGTRKIFDFGTVRIGELSYKQNEKTIKVQAVGVVSVPADAQIVFTTTWNDLFITNFLSKFQKDDLKGLLLFQPSASVVISDVDSDYYDEALASVRGLTGLDTIQFAGAPISMKGLKAMHLEEFRLLKNFDISRTNVDLREFVKLPTLYRVEMVNIEFMRNADAVIKALARNSDNRLTTLFVAGCSLEDKDMEELSHTKISALDLSNNDKISDAGIENLLKMPNLVYLQLDGCQSITTKSIETFKLMAKRKLRILNFSEPNFTQADRAALKKQLPKGFNLTLSPEKEKVDDGLIPDMWSSGGQ